MEDFLTRFGANGIQGIYCCDDTMAVAATIALKEAGVPEGSIPIIGVGGSRQGLASIKKGSMYGTIAQSPKLTQIQTKDIALKILKEGFKPPYRFDPYYQYVPRPEGHRRERRRVHARRLVRSRDSHPAATIKALRSGSRPDRRLFGLAV